MKPISRRKFLQISALAGAATMMPLPFRWLGSGNANAAFANSPNLYKWFDPVTGAPLPLRGLGAGKSTNTIQVLSPTPDPDFANTNFYEVTVSEFTDQLHPALGPTRLWGYRATNAPAADQSHLGGLIVATRGTATRIRFTNTLPPQHIIPNDTTLPGANQGENRIAVHLHGGYIPWISDGGPFDWWQPNGVGGLSFQNGPGSMFDTPNKPMVPGQADYYYPNDQSTRLMWYHDHAHGITRLNAYAGVATGYLCIDPAQEAKFAPGSVPPVGGPSFIPLVYQDKVFVGPNTLLVDPTWATVARPDVQSTGSLWYDHIYDPKAFRLKKGRGILPPPNPSCVPEFFGDTMLVNGTVTPVVTLEAKRYRFMLLNACNSRFLNINLLEVLPGHEIVTDPKSLLPVNQVNMTTKVPLAPAQPPAAGPPIIQIGTEGGYLVREVVHPNNVFFNPALPSVGNLLLGCAERADIIIDFTGMAGKEFIFYNDALGPFPAGPPSTDYFAGNPATPTAVVGSSPDTRQITRFRIVPATAADPQPAGPIIPANILDPDPRALFGIDLAAVAPGAPIPIPAGARITDLTLNEDFDQFGRLRQLIGTTRPALIGKGFGLEYLQPVQPEDIHPQGEINVWRVFNTSADTHPMHIHLQDCLVLSRQPFKITGGVFTPTGAPRGPEPNELGWKETVKMNPGEVTTILIKWDQPAVPFTVPSSNRATATGGWNMGLPAGTVYNEFVWHCHILEHEEHDMMRPLIITGQNPQRPNIVPTSAAVAATLLPAPQTIPFLVTVAAGETFTVTSSDPLNYPAVQTATGFQVTVNPILIVPTTITVTYTVTSSSGYSSTVTLSIT